MSEPLSNALMKQLGIEPETKCEGQRGFNWGWVPVDATYEPVNAHDDAAAISRAIDRDYPELCGDLTRLLALAGAKSRWS